MLTKRRITDMFADHPPSTLLTVEPGAEAAGGAGSTPAPAKDPGKEPPAAPTFTTEQQAFINRLLSQNKTELRTENESLKGELAKLAESQKGMQTFLDEIARQAEEEVKPGPDDPYETWLKQVTPPDEITKDTKLARVYETFARERFKAGQTIAQLEASLKEMGTKQGDIEKALTSEQERRKTAEQRAIASRKHQLLVDILSRNKVVDPARVMRMYEGDVVYDEQKDTFAYRTADGSLLEPMDGISRDLPDYVRQPAQASGGSGSQGSRTTEPAAVNLPQLREQLATIHSRAQSGRGASQQDITTSMRLRREIKAAEEAQRKAGIA